MEAAEAAKLMYGQRVEVYTIAAELPERGLIEAFDEHGLALALERNQRATGNFVYLPWSTVTGVYYLVANNE